MEYEMELKTERRIGQKIGQAIGEVKGAICACKECNLSYDQTFEKIKDKYSLNDIEAKEKMDQYWK